MDQATRQAEMRGVGESGHSSDAGIPCGNDHRFLVGDAVAHSIVLDALGHDGPADPQRITAPPCGELFFPGADYVAFATITVPGLLTNDTGSTVKAEPPLRCYVSVSCTSAAERGHMLTTASLQARPQRRLRLEAHRPGQVAITIRRNGRATKTLRRAVHAGRHVVTLPRPPRTGKLQVVIATRPAPYETDAVERTLTWRRAR